MNGDKKCCPSSLIKDQYVISWPYSWHSYQENDWYSIFLMTDILLAFFKFNIKQKKTRSKYLYFIDIYSSMYSVSFQSEIQILYYCHIFKHDGSLQRGVYYMTASHRKPQIMEILSREKRCIQKTTNKKAKPLHNNCSWATNSKLCKLTQIGYLNIRDVKNNRFLFFTRNVCHQKYSFKNPTSHYTMFAIREATHPNSHLIIIMHLIMTDRTCK